jgi:cobalt/nickel transport system permease protein
VHIPDGFVNLPTAVATGGVAVSAVAYSLRRTGREMGDRTVPLLGVTAAFIFAAQMLNFPIAAGTSGHFLGATLAAILLGPWAATLVMTAVLLVQALGMADGGITALGANVLNMGVVAVMAGYGFFWVLKRILPHSRTGLMVAAAVASWFSVVGAAAAASAELATSGTMPLGFALPAMVSVHMIIGLGEALLTTAILGAVLAARPELVRGFAGAGMPERTTSRSQVWSFVVGAIVVAAALALFIAPFASHAPDGLQRVAAGTGLSGTATKPAWDFSPFRGYHLPGLGGGKIGTALVGLAGTLVLFTLVVVVGRAAGRRRGIGRRRSIGRRHAGSSTTVLRPDTHLQEEH